MGFGFFFSKGSDIRSGFPGLVTPLNLANQSFSYFTMRPIVDLTWKKKKAVMRFFHSLSFTSEWHQLAQMGSAEAQQSQTFFAERR